MQRYATILMAGRSRRFGGGDKCLTSLRGQPIAFYALEAFRKAENFDRYLLVYRDESQKKLFENFVKKKYSAGELAKIVWVTGGPERMFSVFNALEFVHKQLRADAYIFIHDGARPMITAEQILAIDALLSPERGVVLGHRATDTIIAATAESDPETDRKNPITTAHPPLTISAQRRQYLWRDALWVLETPQAFYFPAIFKDYGAAIHSRRHFTDDSSIFSGAIKILENSRVNLKITAKEDLELLSKII
ncbi:MAG: 2-C-methyl-D-erythritol 4-phosphate cytidylyltransferase [Puniceicoccales bacterium]|jgi:2-C-methyl-D-erythritol 4-phosphate cytidylyltransferase|nr:2-C-methyl-D-erythritol 4-phosphate cytidylyltransferase [Puniceicoccales bacterium]